MTAPVNGQHSELRTLANHFVNQTFYGTLLREMRESSQPTVLDSGPGSMTFIRQLDQELIKRISERGDSPAAAALCRQLGVGSTLPQGSQTKTVSPDVLRAETVSPDVLEAARRGLGRLLWGGRGDE